MNEGFATKPEDLEKDCFINNDGTTESTVNDFVCLEFVCKKNNSKVVEVLDAEGETVCFAPIAIALLIVQLLNDCNSFD
jgi:hypothetical protein